MEEIVKLLKEVIKELKTLNQNIWVLVEREVNE
jgi:hypothetical protein